MKIIEACW